MQEQGWKLLDRELDAQTIEETTRYLAREKHIERQGTQAVVVFRLAAEWLALAATAFDEIIEMRPIHTLPHRGNDIVLGVTNVRGELLICVSLARLLNVDAGSETGNGRQSEFRRLIVLRNEGNRIVFPVDAVLGIHLFDPEDVREVPATVAKAGTNYTKAMVLLESKAIGLLDDQLVFYAVNRGLG